MGVISSRCCGARPSSYSSSPPPGNEWHTTAGGKPTKRYSLIGDDYQTLDQVSRALSDVGLESSNLIVGIDFTRSNEWSGKLSFHNRSLHDLDCSPNPYEQAISIFGRTLSSFDDDNLIPCFGFGDVSTHDQDVFSFYENNRPCLGFEDALARYRELVPNVRLAGPTSFAPIIETAIDIVDESGGQYHILLIIADGQVTRSIHTRNGQPSPQEKATIDSIVRASNYPLSIVLVGVGDGPWDTMKEFDDSIPHREFDNFQFVNFTEIMSRKTLTIKKEADFALAALMEIPSQYSATIELQLLGKRRGGTPGRGCLPPPPTCFIPPNPYPNHIQPNKYGQTEAYQPAPDPSESPPNHKICPLCRTRPNNLELGCGHQTCENCGNI